MRLRFFVILLLAVVFPRLAFTQSVRWEPPGGMLPVGQTRGIKLIFEGCAPKGQPIIPRVNGLTLQFYEQSSSTTVINLTISQSVTLTYAVALTRNERIEIPSFEVETDKGRVRVPAARFEPTGATIGNSGTPLESAATAKLTVTPTSVWVGEVFALVTTAEATRSYVPQIQRTFEWNPDPLLAEGWSNPEQVDFNSGGEPHVGITFRARAIARAAGTLKLNPATHIISLSVGMSGFGFFQQRQMDQFSVASNTPALEVKALPPQPLGFNGAVGQFKLASKVVPANAAIGEPVTWTLELSGTGNWPDIPGLPSREVSKDFNIVQPQAKRTPAEGKLFDATLAEDVVLVPTKAGTYTLGPISFVYFDPKSGGYKTVSTPRTAITVTAPEASKFTLTPPPAENSTENQPGTKTGSAAVTLSGTPPPVATLPSGIPRDPLSGTKVASIPRTPGEVLMACLVPVTVLLVFWIALATRRAQQTDPVLPRRQARERIASTLAKLKTASAEERPALLLNWQRDAARLWEIPYAAPSAA
ncbi:MAG: BatD family protein, partial [Opitutaceae bacterium]